MTDVIPVKRRDATSLGEFVNGDQIPSQYIGGLIGKNILINAECLINQRAFAGGALASGVYGYDRFKAGTGGCNFSVSVGVWTHTSGPIVQIVEAPTGVYGTDVTFSVEDPTGPINVNIGGMTGTITAGSGRRGVTFAIPSGSGNLTAQWSATGVTYKRPQLERGDAVSGYDYRSIGHELLLCQRYYEVGDYFHSAYGSAGQQINTSVPFKSTKLAAPAITVVGAAYSNASGATSFNTTANQTTIQYTATATGTATLQCSWVADSEL